MNINESKGNFWQKKLFVQQPGSPYQTVEVLLNRIYGYGKSLFQSLLDFHIEPWNPIFSVSLLLCRDYWIFSLIGHFEAFILWKPFTARILCL